MKRIILNLLIIAFIASFGVACKEKSKQSQEASQPVAVNYLQESEEDFDERMTWWREARFGMFIHWGVYAVPAGTYKGKQIKGIGEWIMDKASIPVNEYEGLAKQFNPTEFDANEWAKIMKQAGMKYLVITSKHHDGFALWDSKVSDYNMVDFAPYGKDILAALSKACKKEGIKFGLYHSIMDWHHPDAQGNSYPDYNYRDPEKANPNFPKYYNNYMKPQLKELIESYDPEIIWFDGEWIPDFTHEMGQDLYQYVRSLKPNILINNRVDKGRQGMQGMDKSDKDYAGDFGTPEQEILEGTADVDWESCMTMNDTWGFKSYDENWKSEGVLIHNLIDVAAKGGNYLLNVGPTAEGLIPAPSVERLAAMGRWLDVNGEAIYATDKLDNNYKQGESIRYTKKVGQPYYYAISLETPGDEITFTYVKPEKNSQVNLLGYDSPLEWSYDEEKGLSIKVPAEAKAAIAEPTAWAFKIKGMEVNP